MLVTELSEKMVDIMKLPDKVSTGTLNSLVTGFPLRPLKSPVTSIQGAALATSKQTRAH